MLNPAQILEMNPEDEAEEDGANVDLDSQRKGKCVVLKTSTRQVSKLSPKIDAACVFFAFLFLSSCGIHSLVEFYCSLSSSM